jgi:hypothetical protein
MNLSSRIRGWAAKARALASTPVGQQVGRFVRLAAVTAATAWVGGGHVLSRAAVWGAVVGGVEVAYREWRQTVALGDVKALAEAIPVDPVPAAPADAAQVSVSVPVAAVPADPSPSVDGAPVSPSQGL